MALVPSTRQLFSSTVRLRSRNVRHLKSKQLVYSEFGDPVKVLKCEEVSIDNLNCQDVLVRMLAAPINPADINTIQGGCPKTIWNLYTNLIQSQYFNNKIIKVPTRQNKVLRWYVLTNKYRYYNTEQNRHGI